MNHNNNLIEHMESQEMIISKIYFNGDSNMAGSEVHHDDAIPQHISNYFKACDVENQALIGGSNDYIYESTMEYLRHHRPDLVVIGWSDSGRIQIFDDTDGNAIQLNAIGVGQIPMHYEPIKKLLQDRMSVGSDYSKHISFYWHYKIYSLHNYLKHLGIKHLFFNAFDLFGPLKSHKQYHVDWNHSYFNPYDITYVNWCLANGYQEVTKGHFHFVPEAQKAWADLLCSHISTYL